MRPINNSGTNKSRCQLPHMADSQEQVLLWRAAIKAIGRALRHELGKEPKEVPDGIRRAIERADQDKRKANEN
jgi:hypothetical protein